MGALKASPPPLRRCVPYVRIRVICPVLHVTFIVQNSHLMSKLDLQNRFSLTLMRGREGGTYQNHPKPIDREGKAEENETGLVGDSEFFCLFFFFFFVRVADGG